MSENFVPSSQLVSLSKAINAASDQITKELIEIEKGLNVLRLGVIANVQLRTWSLNDPLEETGQVTRVESLVYGRKDGKWGLLVCDWCEEYQDFPEDDSCFTFLRDASRETRLAAMEKIPDLIAALAREAEELNKRLSQQLSVAKWLKSELKKP